MSNHVLPATVDCRRKLKEYAVQRMMLLNARSRHLTPEPCLAGIRSFQLGAPGAHNIRMRLQDACELIGCIGIVDTQVV
jgi:hypothetical protein